MVRSMTARHQSQVALPSLQTALQSKTSTAWASTGSWGPVVNGCADLAGVDRTWIDAFSKRRAAIVGDMAARGETSAAATRVATLEPPPGQANGRQR